MNGSPVNCQLRPAGILLDAVAESRDPFAPSVAGERPLDDGEIQGSVMAFK